MGFIATFSSLWVLVMLASMVNARVINKRAAFYIANETMCIVDGQLYFNGDPVPTDDHCEKCTCRPPGFSCVLRDCEAKPGCKAVRKDGECCPDYICGCSHNGNVYKDGDFIRDLQNPCYTCRCHGSSISCTFADCLFRSDCGPEYIQGECCPRYDHCPPLSTTQKTTPIITTVPITYDETTKPLFNLTSPPHERLATHTTIFPATGTVTADGEETHTTETYEKSEISVVSSDAMQTTHGHDSTVTPSSESSTSHVTHAHTLTGTTFALKEVSETSPEVHEDSSQKPAESFSTETTFSATDVKTDSDAKDFSSTSVTKEHSSESDSFSVLHDSQTTEVTHERQTDEYVTKMSQDRQTDVSVTEASHDSQEDELLAQVSHDDKEDESEIELSSGSQTTELVTDVSHVEETDQSAEEISHHSETDNTLLESDGTVSMPFAEDTPEATAETTEENDSTVFPSLYEILKNTTDTLTTHEESRTSPEDDIHSSHEAFSPLSDVVEGSYGTSPSLMITVTMAGDTDTELSPVKAFTTTETHDTHSGTVVSDYSTSEVQDTTTDKIREDIVTSDTSSPSVALSDEQKTKSEVEDVTTPSASEHSDFGESESHTVESETKFHLFSIGSVDDDEDSTDELDSDENEISIQDAEEFDLFAVAATPSGESQKSETTVHDHISHFPSSEVTHTETSETTQEESDDVTRVSEYHLQTEETISADSNVGDIDSHDHPLPAAEGTATTEISHPSQHTEFEFNRETTKVQSMHHDSAGNQNETTVNDGGNNQDIQELDVLSSWFTADKTEKDSDVTQSTTEHLPDHVDPLNEAFGEVNAEASHTVSEDHEVLHLLSEGVNVLSSADEINTEGEQVQTETESSSKPSVLVTTEGSTETMIIMEAESDVFLTTTEDISTISSAEDVIITSSRASEKLSTVSELKTTVHTPKTPATFTFFPEVSSSDANESTDEQVFQDDLSIKSEEHEFLSQKSHITSTESPEQDKSEFNRNNGIILSTTDIPADGLDLSEHDTEVSSLISVPHKHETSESSTTTGSDDTSESTIAASSPEESSDEGRNDVSTATISSESGTTLKQITEEPKPTNDYDDENAATSSVLGSDNISEAEHLDAEKESTSVNELSTDSQHNIDDQVADNTSEITMDAEESIVNNGFESVTDYLYTTKSDESNVISTTQDHVSLSEEDHDTQGHYSIDGETYHTQNGEHIRTSRSTSSNSMASSITAQYPEKTVQTRHISDDQNENTEASAENGITVSFFGSTETTDDENKSVAESLHIEIIPTGETLESTHSTYSNSAEISSRSFESDENLSATPKTDDSHKSQVTKLVSYEVGKPSGADKELNEDQTKETEDEPKEEEWATTVEISSNAEPTPDDLLIDSNVAPDLIVPVHHHPHPVPSNSADTKHFILPDHDNDVTTDHVTNPSITLTPRVTSSISDLESGETVNEESSESYDNNNDSGNDEDSISRFSRTSERYATNEVNVDVDISSSTTENQPTISSYTMDAETETDYLYDSTENNEEHTTNFLSSEQTKSAFASENSQTPPNADSEDEELIGKEFQNGPEKGGEWFEPTIPVLSAINVHKSKTETPDDSVTTVTYSTSTDIKETFTLKNEEASHFVTEVVGQTQTSLDGDHTDGRDFANSVDEEVLETKSTSEVPSSTSASYETTYLGTVSDSEHDEDIHRSFYTSVPSTDLKTNVPTDKEPQGNDVEVTVSAKLTFVADEASGSSSEGLNAVQNSEVKELDEQKETERDELLEQSTVDGVTQKYTIRQDHSDESIRTTTTKTNTVSQRDEIESFTTDEYEHRTAEKYDHFSEQQETKEKSKSSSQHDVQNIGSETTKEAGISLNDFMLSDGTGSMRFTDIVTDGSDVITHHTSTFEPEVVDEENQLRTNPEQVTNDEDLYPEGKSEENPSEEAAAVATTKVNGNEVTESEQNEEQTFDGDFASEKTAEHSVPSRDSTEGLKHTNDDDYSTEYSSTSYYKSTTPLPLLLFNELVEKVKEDNSVNRNAQQIDEENSTEKPEEVDEILRELLSDEEIKEDLEEQSDTDFEVTANSEHEFLKTTQRDRHEHDLISATSTLGYDEKQTEIHSSSSSSRPEEVVSQNSYSTEHSHFDDNLDESEKVTDSTTTSSQVTEQNKKSEKNVSRVFVLRKSHDDYQSDAENPKKKEEHADEKNDVEYSSKSPEIVVDDPNDTNQEGHDETAVTTEVITQQNKGSTDDTHHRNYHEGDLEISPTSRAADPTSTVDADVRDATTPSSEVMFNSESAEVAESSEDGKLKDTHDGVSGPETTPDSIHSDSA